MEATNYFVEPFSEKSFLILSHRGFWGGNIIENTRLSCQLAYRAGADIAEVDVCRSADGIYYLFHDGNEPKLLGRQEPFSQLSSQELDTINLRNSLGNPSGYHLEKLEDFLSWLPASRLVNLDRSWPYWRDERFFDILARSCKAYQLLLKSPVQEELLEQLAACQLDIAYMPIVHSQEDYRLVQAYPEIRTVGAEIIVPDAGSDLLDRHWLQLLRDQGMLIVANAEKLGEEYNLFQSLDDDHSLAKGEGEGWGKMLAAGVNVIQTDWPNFLSEFRKERDEGDGNASTGVENRGGLATP